MDRSFLSLLLNDNRHKKRKMPRKKRLRCWSIGISRFQRREAAEAGRPTPPAKALPTLSFLSRVITGDNTGRSAAQNKTAILPRQRPGRAERCCWRCKARWPPPYLSYIPRRHGDCPAGHWQGRAGHACPFSLTCLLSVILVLQKQTSNTGEKWGMRVEDAAGTSCAEVPDGTAAMIVVSTKAIPGVRASSWPAGPWEHAGDWRGGR